MTFLLFSLLITILSATFSWSMKNDKIDYESVVEKLEKFNSTLLLKLEERLDMRKEEMAATLKQAGKEAKSIKAAIDLFLENVELISERSNVRDLVDNILIPGKIPHQFFCAMAIYEDVLQHTYQRKGVNLYKPRFEEPVDRNKNAPLFVTESLIEELMKRAPEIAPETIRSIAYDNLPPFRGPAAKIYHYHDSVLTNFIAWRRLIEEERLPLAQSVVAELKLQYGDNWKSIVSEFALVHARGWPLAGHVQNKLLKEYVTFINRDSTGATDFDTILQKLMPSGWYFPIKHMMYVNLLFRAVHKCDDYAVRELDFETFLLNADYVLPQSRVCTSSKTRNLDWYLTSRHTTPGSTPAGPVH